jgi:translocon-associated protein subunit gamma
MIDLYSSIISFIAVTLASTYLVALAYKNTKFVLKHKVNSDMKSFIIK